MSAGDDPAGDDEEVINAPPWKRKKDDAEPSGPIQRLTQEEPDRAGLPLRRSWLDFMRRRKK